ncbi:MULTISPECIES: hypothetical protein [Heyndrickxia]|nr:hypothetical protein [Heyndrickxia shackletonii]
MKLRIIKKVVETVKSAVWLKNLARKLSAKIKSYRRTFQQNVKMG